MALMTVAVTVAAVTTTVAVTAEIKLHLRTGDLISWAVIQSSRAGG